MKFNKFLIDHYRAISRAEVPVGNNLIPLIGINESGKTSLLQAILAFDKFSDRYGGGVHLNYKDKYQIAKHDCTIAAEVTIDGEADLDTLSTSLQLTRGSELLKTLEYAYEKATRFIIKRTLSAAHKPYSISGLDIPDRRNRQVANAIYRVLPFLLYFDDFTDRVPEYVEYAPSEARHRLRNSKLGEWDRILNEIFRRATNGEHTLQTFINMEDKDAQEGLLSDINDALNHDIISAWRRLKSIGGNLADDQIDLQLRLRYSVDGKISRFEFKVSDRSTERQRFFNVVERSKGFQWFFNFQMKLRFNPKYQDRTSGAIYLLDEPGSYLHSSAQEELLVTLDDISQTNSILYCTHSQHLLDPNRINIGQTRIVTKDKGSIDIIPFGSASGSKFQGALTPLYDALHLRTGAFNRRISRALITEGITDYYFISMLLQYRKDWKYDSVDVIPGAGAAHLKDLISFAISFCDDFRVLLDSDRAGVEAYEQYARFFGDSQIDRLILYATPSVSDGIVLEDFLSTEDTQRLNELTDSSDPKRAVAKLYFSSKKAGKEFWRGIDNTTTANLSLLQREIERLDHSDC